MNRSQVRRHQQHAYIESNLLTAEIDADRVPDANVLVHRKRGQSEETRDLHRITHSIGFPMAPKAEGLAKDTVEDDLVALGVS